MNLDTFINRQKNKQQPQYKPVVCAPAVFSAVRGIDDEQQKCRECEQQDRKIGWKIILQVKIKIADHIPAKARTGTNHVITHESHCVCTEKEGYNIHQKPSNCCRLE